MASYLVRHACGHQSTVNLLGPGRQREQRLRWLAEQPCKACLRATTQERADAAAERDALPELDGTDKQVAWANAIRYTTFLLIDAFFAANPTDLDEPMPMPDELAFAPGETVTLRALLDRLRGEDRAKWWIDHCRDAERAGKRPRLIDGSYNDLERVTERDFVTGLIRELVGFRALTEGQRTLRNAYGAIAPKPGGSAPAPSMRRNANSLEEKESP